MLAPNAHSWVWQGLVPLVTGASFRQQINSCVWPSNQTHTIKVTTKIILSSAGPMSHACPVWPHPLPLTYYVILCIYVFIFYYHYHFRIFGCGGSSPILVNMSMWTQIKESKQHHINKEDTTTTSRCRRKKISSDHGVTIGPMPTSFFTKSIYVWLMLDSKKYISLSLST